MFCKPVMSVGYLVVLCPVYVQESKNSKLTKQFFELELSQQDKTWYYRKILSFIIFL